MEIEDRHESEAHHKSKNKLRFIKQFRFTPKEKKVWRVLLAFLLVLTILAGLFGLGYKLGYKDGKSESKPTNSMTEFFNSSSNPFRSTTGTVTKVSSSEITVKATRGGEKKITLNDKTKVTKGTAMLQKTDLKNDQSVTVFVREESGNLVATRIVVRD